MGPWGWWANIISTYVSISIHLCLLAGFQTWLLKRLFLKGLWGRIRRMRPLGLLSGEVPFRFQWRLWVCSPIQAPHVSVCPRIFPWPHPDGTPCMQSGGVCWKLGVSISFPTRRKHSRIVGGMAPPKSQSLMPPETTETYRHSLCFCLLSRDQDARRGKQDFLGSTSN